MFVLKEFLPIPHTRSLLRILWKDILIKTYFDSNTLMYVQINFFEENEVQNDYHRYVLIEMMTMWRICTPQVYLDVMI